jgi:Trk K+ transport system NAD-binding subunit
VIPLFAVLCVISVSLLIVRVGAIALVMTGLSPQVARFQSRSAFFGVGFTTPEADKVMTNPVRRELVLTLMLLGNAGIITTVSTVVVSLVDADGDAGLLGQVWFRMLFLAGGVGCLWVLTFSNWLDRYLSPPVAWALRRWTRLDAVDYSELLHLAHDYAVTEFPVMEGGWMAGQALAEMRLGDEGVMILGIQRADGSYVGAPKGTVGVEPGDRVVAYGVLEKLKELETRPTGAGGASAHVAAVEEKRVQESAASRPRDLPRRLPRRRIEP